MGSRRRIPLAVATALLVAACSPATTVGPPTTLAQTPPESDWNAPGDDDDDWYDDGGGQGAASDDAGQGAVPGSDGQLVGVWIGEGVDILGNPSMIETVLQSDGRFSQTTYSSGDPIWLTGTYRLLDEATIRFTFEDHTRRWCGPLGCQDLYFQDGETVFFEFTDAHTLVTWGYQNPARQIHRRAG